MRRTNRGGHEPEITLKMQYRIEVYYTRYHIIIIIILN